jgi:hypothetical protein
MLGVVLMLFEEKATQLLPDWFLRQHRFQSARQLRVSLNSEGLPPLRPEILTPPAWGDNYLTPDPAGRQRRRRRSWCSARPPSAWP